MLHQSAGGIVVGPDGKIVVVNQKGNSWSLPKGHIEQGETEKEAARREIYEETGIYEFEIIKKLGSYERPTIGKGGIGDDTEHIKHITLFLCRTNETELNPIDPDNPEAVWLMPEEVEAKLHHLKDREMYRRYLPEIQSLLTE